MDNGNCPVFSALVLLVKCSRDREYSVALIPTGLLSITGYNLYRQASFPCPEPVVTSAEPLLDLEVGEEMLGVRDTSEVSRRGRLAGRLQRVIAVPLPSSLSRGQRERHSPGGWGEWRSRCSAPANVLPGPTVLLSKTFQGLKGKRERQKGDKKQREE